MAISNGYVTLADLTGYLDQGGAASLGTGNDTEMEQAIEAASRQIDGECRRRFYQDGSATLKIYAAHDLYLLDVDPISTTTGLVVATDTDDDGVADTTWTTADYQLEPLNGIVDGIAGWPYTRIRAIGDHLFPIEASGRAAVHITARWGWAAVPDAIVSATLIQAAYLFRRKDAVTGILGTTDFGAVTVRAGLDRDAAALIAPYRRGVAVA